MRLMALEKHLNGQTASEEGESELVQCQPAKNFEEIPSEQCFPQIQTFHPPPNGPLSIPPTILECDDCDE